MYIRILLFLLLGQDVKLECSGCDRVLRIGNTAYYCPGSEGIMFFRCDVINQTAFTLLYNDGFFAADSRDSPIIFHEDGVFSIELRSVMADGLFANFTTFMWFDTADIMDNVSITCTSLNDAESMMIHRIGK